MYSEHGSNVSATSWEFGIHRKQESDNDSDMFELDDFSSSGDSDTEDREDLQETVPAHRYGDREGDDGVEDSRYYFYRKGLWGSSLHVQEGCIYCVSITGRKSEIIM